MTLLQMGWEKTSEVDEPFRLHAWVNIAVALLIRNVAQAEFTMALFMGPDTPAYIEALVADRRGLRVAAFALEGCAPRRAAVFVDRGDLTAREREVGRLIAWGHTVREIAQCLGLSVKTVDSHRTHIYGKTDCRKRSEFVAYAVRAGLLTEEDPCSSAWDTTARRSRPGTARSCARSCGRR